LFDLNGKTALITGGSGGIGAAIAKLLHANGASVVISGTNEEKLSRLCNELGNRAYFERCDLSNKDQVNQLYNAAESHTGKIDILISNAGINKDNLAVRLKDQDFIDVVNVNLLASFILSRSAIKGMMKQKWGRIVYISSIIGSIGNIGQSNYSATKAGLEGMCRSLAREVASRNITVNSIAPGFIQTAMTDKLPEEYKEQLLSNIPTKRMGVPEDIAASVLFLVSQEAGYINGHTLHVNGGMYMN
jgi:3-oxoacyl-[acyl-carrier protein] reductase